MPFQTIHTDYGLSRLAEAEAAGTPINLPEMAVGDGNGNPTEPDPEQTDLVRERFPFRGGSLNNRGGAGLGALALLYERSSASDYRGLRLSRLV